MTVTSREIHEPVKETAQPVKKPIGVLSGSHIERMFVTALRIGAWTLIALSVLGTFYGARGNAIPLSLVVIWQDITSQLAIALAAFIGQGLLSLIQWGGRQLAQRDRRWWLVYLLSLSLSAWWNWTAYGTPLIGLHVPWLIAAGIVLGSDIFPEWALVKR